MHSTTKVHTEYFGNELGLHSALLSALCHYKAGALDTRIAPAKLRFVARSGAVRLIIPSLHVVILDCSNHVNLP